MTQQPKGIDVAGFRLPAGPQHKSDLESLIARAGADLRAMVDGILVEINALTRLRRVSALRLLADRMLGLMLRLAHFQKGSTIAERRHYCSLWLTAMDLVGHGNLETIDLADGNQVLIVARKGCCLDYLAFPDAYCSSCPKQDDAVRIGRQTSDALAELEMV